MKTNLTLRIKFYFTLLNTKATIYMLFCKTLFKKKYRPKINSFQAALDKAKEFL